MIAAVHAALMPPLAQRDSDFQAAWYYSIIIAAAILLAAYGFWLVQPRLRAMWRRGDQALALAVGGAVVVAFLMFSAMLVTVIIALKPFSVRGSG